MKSVKNKFLYVFSILVCSVVSANLPLRSVSAVGPGNFQFASVNNSGVRSNGEVKNVVMSGDGTVLSFASAGTNIVDNDTNAAEDVFVRDLKTNTTTRISVSSTGDQGNDKSRVSRLSYDGRYVSFGSQATNLIQGDTNGVSDIFIHDRTMGTTELVTKDINGNIANGLTSYFDMSANGRYFVFSSKATNLGQSTTSTYSQVFLKDMETGEINLLSKDATDNQGNNNSYDVSISCDGGVAVFASDSSNITNGDINSVRDLFVVEMGGTSYNIANITFGSNSANQQPSMSCNGNAISFQSKATNLVPVDTNGKDDIFKYNLIDKSISLVSLSSSGLQGSEDSTGLPCISGNGRYIVFSSIANNLAGSSGGSSGNDNFIRDTKSGTTYLATYRTDGTQAGGSYSCGISEDGSKYSVIGANYMILSQQGSSVIVGDTGF